MKPKLTDKVIRGLQSIRAKAKLAPVNPQRNYREEDDEEAATKWIDRMTNVKIQFGRIRRTLRLQKKHESN